MSITKIEIQNDGCVVKLTNENGFDYEIKNDTLKINNRKSSFKKIKRYSCNLSPSIEIK